MSRKEFVRLMESNIWMLDKYADKLRIDQAQLSGFPRQQMSILVRLHQGGRAMLKDIARREFVSTPNLCAVFRKLESDGLVLRVVDVVQNWPRTHWKHFVMVLKKCFHHFLAKKKQNLPRH